jgi:hypothetical protein
LTITCGLLIWRSLLTSSIPGSWRILVSKTGAHWYSSSVFVLWRVNWYGARAVPAPEVDGRRVDHVRADARDLRQLRPQACDDLVDAELSFGPRLEFDHHAPGIEAAAGAPPADRTAERRNIRILGDHVRHLQLMSDHVVEGRALHRLGND